MISIKYLKLYFKFILYEIYGLLKITDNYHRIKLFGLLNIINNFLFKKVVLPKDKCIKYYLKKNLSKWEKIKFLGNKNKILITGFVHLPTDYMTNALIAKFLEEKYNTKSLCVLEKGDYLGESIFRSFNLKNFRYLDKGNFFFRLLLFKKSIKVVSQYKNIDQFLKFKLGNVHLGKITYDHYLRHTGNCSGNINDFKICYLLSKALNYDLEFKKILNKNNFELCVQSEHQFIPSALSFQNCLERNINLFSRERGPKWIAISKFNNKNDIFTAREKIDLNYFKYFSNKYKKKASKLGKEIITNRLRGKDNLSLKAWGINNFLKKKISFNQFRKNNKWDNKKPIVCIFGHLFVDGSYSSGRRLHTDNLVWLQSTLKIIKDIKSVNWIIKPHPLEKSYKTSTTTYNEVMKFAKKYKHIKLADKRISNFLLSKNIIATVSCNGTAPLEYAGLGIPSVVCGNTHYTKLGFLKEAKTIQEYKKLLSNIHKLKKLKKKYSEKANIYIYLAGKLILIDNELIPEVISPLGRLSEYSKNKFWQDATRKIKKFNYKKSFLRKMFFLQIDNNLGTTINYKLLNKEFKKI